MKINSDLFSRFASATELVQLDGSESEIFLPTLLNPVVQLVGPIRRFAGFSTTAPQSKSFIAETQLGLNASTATTTVTLCTFARGLWQLVLSWTHLANFTQASDAAANPAGLLELLDTAATIAAGRLLGTYAVNGIPQEKVLAFPMLFPDDGWAIRISLGTTGVGQTHHATVAVVANRLH